ncbi:MAG: threonine-phosphate decarboxylase CobD [Candidatus Omnitrophota bacterium]
MNSTNSSNSINSHGGYSGDRKGVLDFSLSINPLGPPPAVKELLRRGRDCLSRYPQPYSRDLILRLAQYKNISPDNLLITNGSIEGIYIVARLLGGKSVFIPAPTFSEYERAVRVNRGRCVFGLSSDIDAIFICNPNNPTGTVMSREDLEQLVRQCEKNDVLLIVDEAFVDFLPGADSVSLVGRCPRHSHLLVISSFTKLFALAGLRIGYIAGHRRLIGRLRRFCFPWAVNCLSQQAAGAALYDTAYIGKTRRFVIKEREFLLRRLSAIRGLTAYKSAANFILCRVTDKRNDAPGLTKALLKQGIFIRDCSNFRGLDNRYFRLGVKRRRENIKLLCELEKSLRV